MNRSLDVSTSYLVSAGRLGAGMFARSVGPRPEKPLVLYEFEACPFCRKVREALSELDLEAEVRPCPKGGTRFRPEVKQRGGKAQFPFLIDENTGMEMYESRDIIRYLWERYGSGRAPLRYWFDPVSTVNAGLSGLWRGMRGGKARGKKAPEQPLELYSFEASPYCRIVREALCELELPYLLHNVAKKSPSRDAFIRRAGKMQVPFLVDPNTGMQTFESDDIVRYLDETYG